MFGIFATFCSVFVDYFFLDQLIYYLANRQKEAKGVFRHLGNTLILAIILMLMSGMIPNLCSKYEAI